MKTGLSVVETMNRPTTKGQAVDDDLGAGFWLKMVGAIFALGIAGLIIFAIIGMAWYAWGALGGFLFVVAVLAMISWIYDRTHKKRYEDELTDAEEVATRY